MTAWRQDADVQMPGAVPNAKGLGGTERKQSLSYSTAAIARNNLYDKGCLGATEEATHCNKYHSSEISTLSDLRLITGTLQLRNELVPALTMKCDNGDGH
jgi:hypothetical protein